MASLAIAHRSKGPVLLHATQAVSDGIAYGHGGDGWAFAPLGLGFEQISSRHIALVLRGGTVHAFEWPPLSRHAAFPFGFRLQVGRVTQESPLELLLTKSGLQPQVARRTQKMPPSSSTDRSNGRRSISVDDRPSWVAARTARTSTGRTGESVSDSTTSIAGDSDSAGCTANTTSTSGSQRRHPDVQVTRPVLPLPVDLRRRVGRAGSVHVRRFR